MNTVEMSCGSIVILDPAAGADTIPFIADEESLGSGLITEAVPGKVESLCVKDCVTALDKVAKESVTNEEICPINTEALLNGFIVKF